MSTENLAQKKNYDYDVGFLDNDELLDIDTQIKSNFLEKEETKTQTTGSTDKYEGLKEIESPLFYYKNKVPITNSYFVSLQKWEGFVQEIGEDSILVRLIDLTNNYPDEDAEIPFEEIEEDDIKLIKPGAIFYWNIGYNKVPSGTQRSSIIRFRRLPAWNEYELESAKVLAKKLSEKLNRK